MSRNRIPRPRGGRNSGKHAEMVIFNPTPGTPICRGSELHLWSELLPLIVKLYSLGLAQDPKHARASAAPRKNATVGLGAHQGIDFRNTLHRPAAPLSSGASDACDGHRTPDGRTPPDGRRRTPPADLHGLRSSKGSTQNLRKNKRDAQDGAEEIRGRWGHVQNSRAWPVAHQTCNVRGPKKGPPLGTGAVGAR